MRSTNYIFNQLVVAISSKIKGCFVLSITVLSNFYIDSEERFLRLQSSINSFCDADIAKWIINVRGPLAEKVKSFLSDRLGKKLYISRKESKAGWINDTLQLAELIETEYVHYWVEDHICTVPPETLNEIYKSIYKSGIDIINYSFFGLGAHVKEFEGLRYQEIGFLRFLEYNHDANLKRQKNSKKLYQGNGAFLVSLLSIMKTGYFKKLLSDKFPKLPNWPKYLPFNFEKSPKATHLLPFKIGFTTVELFAPIDDDSHISGSSLISRGLYPNRVSRKHMLDLRNQLEIRNYIYLKSILKKNKLITVIYKIIRRIGYWLT